MRPFEEALRSMARGMKTFLIVTLGCKINQCESTVMAEVLEGAGLTAVSEGMEADLIIINTCTVTAKTDSRSVHAIRRARSRSPQSTIVVTGCLAQRFPGEIGTMPEVDFVLGNKEKYSLAQIVGMLRRNEDLERIQVSDIAQTKEFSEFRLHRFSDYTRAFMKIQDGCNCSCSYCAVRLARGASRSLTVKSVLEQFRFFQSGGYHEIVLTGINLGSYGRDLSPPSSLADLLSVLVSVSDGTRIRLSSIEPHEWDEQLRQTLIMNPTICGHVHIPLQSGSDSVLARMNRRYSAQNYASLVKSIHQELPHSCIGADVISGFPGETDREFAETVSLIESLPLSYLHVFGYSSRPGTVASEMGAACSSKVIRQRVSILRGISGHKRSEFRAGQKGRRLKALVLGKRDRQSGSLIGLTDNYINVLFEGNNSLYNTFQNIKVVHISDTTVRGELC